MPHNEDYHRLYHMWEAATEAVQYVQGCTRDDLDADRKLQHTLVHLLEIVGEAAGRISHRSARTIRIFPGQPWSVCAIA